MNLGNGFLGSTKLETSTSNLEIIPKSPSHWTSRYTLCSFSFMNDSDCNVLINNDTELFLRAGQGFNVSHGEPEINSFKILNDNVKYNWIGVY